MVRTFSLDHGSPRSSPTKASNNFPDYRIAATLEPYRLHGTLSISYLSLTVTIEDLGSNEPLQLLEMTVEGQEQATLSQ
jgi:hypothetical protein